MNINQLESSDSTRKQACQAQVKFVCSPLLGVLAGLAATGTCQEGSRSREARLLPLLMLLMLLLLLLLLMLLDNTH